MRYNYSCEPFFTHPHPFKVLKSLCSLFLFYERLCDHKPNVSTPTLPHTYMRPVQSSYDESPAVPVNGVLVSPSAHTNTTQCVRRPNGSSSKRPAPDQAFSLVVHLPLLPFNQACSHILASSLRYDRTPHSPVYLYLPSVPMDSPQHMSHLDMHSGSPAYFPPNSYQPQPSIPFPHYAFNNSTLSSQQSVHPQQYPCANGSGHQSPTAAPISPPSLRKAGEQSRGERESGMTSKKIVIWTQTPRSWLTPRDREGR